jgi:hypothetical protein
MAAEAARRRRGAVIALDSSDEFIDDAPRVIPATPSRLDARPRAFDAPA